MYVEWVRNVAHDRSWMMALCLIMSIAIVCVIIIIVFNKFKIGPLEKSLNLERLVIFNSLDRWRDFKIFKNRLGLVFELAHVTLVDGNFDLNAIFLSRRLGVKLGDFTNLRRINECVVERNNSVLK